MIEHVIVYTCDVCGARAEERTTQPVPYPLAPPAALRFACPPETWQVIQGRLICGAHTLTVEVV